ncbi:hypothetical protein DUI87_33944 [Hirundo rustica rustica]|uniref:Uncharacterized protein n=1 Tax=Hirundo rustica rustica TaxID=333673 RepID=A0A3M0IS58_HIRRU|nr:hypothetical protein DUI87_33944 [Hirundo rustica rustica]
MAHTGLLGGIVLMMFIKHTYKTKAWTNCYHPVYDGEDLRSLLRVHTNVNPNCFDHSQLNTCQEDGKVYWTTKDTASYAQRLFGECPIGDTWLCFEADHKRLRDIIKEKVLTTKIEKGLDIPSGKKLFIDLVEKISRELNLTECWIRGEQCHREGNLGAASTVMSPRGERWGCATPGPAPRALAAPGGDTKAELGGRQQDHGVQAPALHRQAKSGSLGIPGSGVQRLLELLQPWSCEHCRGCRALGKGPGPGLGLSRWPREQMNLQLVARSREEQGQCWLGEPLGKGLQHQDTGVPQFLSVYSS